MKLIMKYTFSMIALALLISCADQKEVTLQELPVAIVIQTGDAAQDTLVLQDQFGEFVIHYSDKTNTYFITDKEGNKKVEDLIFAKSVGWEFAQILDQKGKMFYINADLETVEKAEPFFGFCGTVPHYTLEIVKKSDEFIFTEDETFFDHDNKDPAKEIFHLSTEIADDVQWINGDKILKYDTNYGISHSYPTDPRRILFTKNSKWGIVQENRDLVINPNVISYSYTDAVFDEIIHENGLLRTRIGDRFGYFGICDAIYPKLGMFENHLASFTKKDGSTGYIDTEGREYFFK